MIQEITGSGMSYKKDFPTSLTCGQVNEVESFLKVTENHPQSGSITVSGTVPGGDHANYGF